MCRGHYFFFNIGISIGFELPRYTVNEGDGSIEVCAALTNGTLERTVTFTLSTQDNSATSTDPVDFSAVALELQFNKTTSRACAVIPISDDNRVEVPENLTVVIDSDDPDVDFVPPTSTVTIVDNDRVVIGFEMERYQEEEGRMVEVCAVIRNGSLERSILVQIFTEDISAEGSRTHTQNLKLYHFFLIPTEPNDYQAINSELVFDSDNERQCISISLENDGVLENIEELQVSLTSDEEAVILEPDKAVISILDTDGNKKFLYFKSLTHIVLYFTLQLPELDLNERHTVEESLMRSSMSLWPFYQELFPRRLLSGSIPWTLLQDVSEH